MEDRYKAAMANAVKTIKSQKDYIAELEAKLQAAESKVGTSEARVRELESAVGEDERCKKRPRASSAAPASTKIEGDNEKNTKLPSQDKQQTEGRGGGLTGVDILAHSGSRRPSSSSTSQQKKDQKEKRSEDANVSNNKPIKKEESRRESGDEEDEPVSVMDIDDSNDHQHRHQRRSYEESSNVSVIGSIGFGGAGAGGGGGGNILEEVASLWGIVKDRPFADAKFTQFTLDRYVFSREMHRKSMEELDAGVERTVLLLREAAYIQPAEVVHRILVNHKRKMAQALRKRRDGEWLKAPVAKSSEAGRLITVAVGLILRLCAVQSYGAHFLNLVFDELLQQLYKNSKGDNQQDEEEEREDRLGGGGDSDAEEKSLATTRPGGRSEADREKEGGRELALRREQHGCAAAMLYAWLAHRSGCPDRIKALIYDLCIVNGKAVALGPLSALIQVRPELLLCGGKEDKRRNLMGRVVYSFCTEALMAQCDAPPVSVVSSAAAPEGIIGNKVEKEGEREARQFVAKIAYEGLARALVGQHYEGEADKVAGFTRGGETAAEIKNRKAKESLDDLAQEILRILSEINPSNSSTKEEAQVTEMLRAFTIIASTKDLKWIEKTLLEEHARGDVTTPAPIIRLLAALARDLAIRGVLEEKSGRMMRLLLVCFTEMLSSSEEEEEVAAGEEEEGRQWACRGLIDLPGSNIGDLKPAISWIRSLDASTQDTLATSTLRSLVYNQKRPHCMVIVREGSQHVQHHADLEIQAVLHDLSLRAISPSLLESKTKNTLKISHENSAMRSKWTAEGGFNHVVLWHLFANARMEELDHPCCKPSEVIIMEGDVVGSPQMGTEFRSLIVELRNRPHPWDVLSLSFSLPERTKSKFKGRYAEHLVKDGYCSRRAYILTATGAAKLCRSWERYESVEELFLQEKAAGRLAVLVPGDGRSVVHMNADDRSKAELRKQGGGEGKVNGKGGSSNSRLALVPHVSAIPITTNRSMVSPTGPPSPGWTPSF